MANRPARRGQLVLDTHVWVWAVEGLTDKLAPAAAAALEQAAKAARWSNPPFRTIFWDPDPLPAPACPSC